MRFTWALEFADHSKKSPSTISATDPHKLLAAFANRGLSSTPVIVLMRSVEAVRRSFEMNDPDPLDFVQVMCFLRLTQAESQLASARSRRTQPRRNLKSSMRCSQTQLIPSAAS